MSNALPERYLYPSSNDISTIPENLLALKIARHSPCLECPQDLCQGLHLLPGNSLVLDSDYEHETQLAELIADVFDPEDPLTYLEYCACGHSMFSHGADQGAIGHDEFIRRGRVAIRIDELLQDINQLLDCGYTDPDIQSLRLQMQIPDEGPASPVSELILDAMTATPSKRPASPASSFLSEGDDFEPPNKKRRVSFSSLSEDSSSSEDDEEPPLAAKHAPRSKKTKTAPARGGRSVGGRQPNKSARATAGKKGKASTVPTHIPPPTEEERAAMVPATNGVNGRDVKVKVEDKMDEGQLNRLATGVTVDAGGNTSVNPTVKAEKPSLIELRKGIIQVVPVENDGQPRSSILLTGLKTLFQKQLPKMPREYIARLVYDSNSKCLAIIKRGLKVVGGICYRPFPHRKFAEIVFFATASVDQVKGYGGMLMDHFKSHIRQTYPDMGHFLTYADNYAVGYFRKQGFSKEISLDRAIWAGYIKDYEGGTIMQCALIPKVDYLKTRETITKQREAILEKIRERSRSHIIHPGIEAWSVRGDSVTPLDPKEIPGLRESGWTSSMAHTIVRPSGKSLERNAMEKILADLQAHPLAWAFLQPVNIEEVPDYPTVIKNPMDFSTMEHKLDTNQYPNLDAFAADAILVFNNCRTYNAEGSLYHKNASKLEKYLKDAVSKVKSKKEEW